MDFPLSIVTIAAATTTLLLLASPTLSRGVHTRWSEDYHGEAKCYHPMAGSFFQQMLHFARLYDYATDLFRHHKSFHLVAPTFSEVFTLDPANVEHILRTNFTNYGKGMYSYDVGRDLLSDDIFTVDGEKWWQQRKLASFEFSTRALRDFSGQIFKRNATRLAHVISAATTSHQIIDVQDWFMKSTMDSIFEDSKVCFTNDVLPDGFHVRKGDILTYLSYPMGRMEFLWDKDAEVFRLERWVDADDIFCPKSPFKFTTFQGTLHHHL